MTFSLLFSQIGPNWLAKFNGVSANTDIRLLNGRYLGSLSHIDRRKLNPEFKILYQLDFAS